MVVGKPDVNSQTNVSDSSFRETKSEVGASPEFLSGVKLRQTGGISKLMSRESSEAETESPRDSPTEFDSALPQETDDNIEQSKQKKLTYMERRELEL